MEGSGGGKEAVTEVEAGGADHCWWWVLGGCCVVDG